MTQKIKKYSRDFLPSDPEARVNTKKKKKKARKKEKERIYIHAPSHRKPNKAGEEAGQSTSCSDYIKSSFAPPEQIPDRPQ
jgi:hypothetical protein